ncbi:WxL domain-containing protein [Enterococcus faecalis]|nr:WxL domain-containing protein [Enterococcus faecalis]
MKKIKFKQLATFSLCCSLLVNSLTGVTAVAETMTIESSPTAESTKESPKESTETSEATTEISREEATQETEKQEKVKEAETEAAQVEVEQEETKTSEVIQPHSVPVPTSGIGVRAGNLETVKQQISSLISSKSFTISNSIAMPAGKMGLNLVTDDKTLVNLEDFSLTANITTLLTSRTATSAQVTKRPASVSASSTGFDILMDATGTMSLNVAMRRIYLDDVTLKVPKYIENVVLNGDIVGTGSTTSSEWVFVSKATATKLNDTSYELGNYSDAPPIYNVSRLNSMYHYLNYMGNPTSSVSVFVIQNLPKSDYTLTVTNRKVTENFKDVNGTAIPAPTGFTQGKKTSITNNDYTFKQSGTLPSTYKASNGKTYQLKGWYKGNTKPATLSTGTPTYKVSYDDNDDLNVVYEEVVPKTVTVPAVDYLFGFINEKGVYDYDAKLTATITEVSGGTVKNGSTITSVPEGVFQKLTIPSKTLTYTETSPVYYGVTKANVQVPKYYKQPTVKPGSYFTGPLGGYPMATIALQNIANGQKSSASVDGSRFDVVPNESAKPNNYLLVSNFWASDTTKTAFSKALSMTTTLNAPSFYTTEDKMFYFLENRRVTEKFVDSNGTEITPPTGFTQGEKTVVDSDDFTYTSAKTLPERHSADGKNYKFQGWYKGNTKPTTLQTGKTPSYDVTYDDQDDMTAVYEEVVTTKLPGATYQFGFVDDSGTIVNPSKIGLKYDLWSLENKVSTVLEKGLAGTNAGNYKNMVIADKEILVPTVANGNSLYSPINITFTLPKYYSAMAPTDGKNSQYPVPTITAHRSDTDDKPVANASTAFAVAKITGSDDTYVLSNTNSEADAPEIKYPRLYRRYAVPLQFRYYTNYNTFSGPAYYTLTQRKVTENFVDSNGAKITPPADFTQGKQTVIDSDNFTYTSAKALPASYTADGKSYVLQGWYKGTEKPTTLETSKTPSYSVTYNDQDDLTVVYKEGTISADLTMRGAVDVIDNEAPMEYWEVLLKNTGEVPLTSIKIKPTTDWMSGISTPTELFILGTGQNTKARPITKEQWEAGFEIPLDNSLPVGGQLTINLIGTKVTGQPDQVLEAAVEVTGNFGNLKASDTVRIKDLDQETKEPTGEGFISVPTFDFGQVGVASATKQHGLKKAADYYGNGTRNPYVRIKKTQPNWSLTAQLSQPKSVTDSLPTATRLLLGAAPVSSFSNYNQPTELKNAIGTTNAIHLTANNAATSIIANQQFTGSDVYQLDFTFDNIKLEVPANQGTAGQQYQAAVTWNLVTGP